MLKKNKEKQKRKESRHTFVGVRAAKFRPKTVYCRKGRHKEDR